MSSERVWFWPFVVLFAAGIFLGAPYPGRLTITGGHPYLGA
jgi:hypothetical protein